MINKKILPLDLQNGVIEMNHGGGGRATAQLIQQIFYRHFKNDTLAKSDDFAKLVLNDSQCAISTDSFVISPLFFPGGDIGSLSVHGTVNDLAMSGYQPKYLTAGFILEEGFPLLQLDRIVESMAKAAEEANVLVIAGDTKVVEKGKGDGVFINTTGIAMPYEQFRDQQFEFGGANVKLGDAIILSGSIGDHGVAIMADREGLQFGTHICSDSASLVHLIKSMLAASPDIHCLRDPTRGGLATVLNEIATQSNVGIRIDESLIPIKEQVHGACELLGLDPLYIANEGKLVCICDAKVAGDILQAMQGHSNGVDAAIIGYVSSDTSGDVIMTTKLGGQRLVDTIVGEQLPRIC